DVALVQLVCDHFFFSSRRRHTRSKRDWSSDVCSSDLLLTVISIELNCWEMPQQNSWVKAPQKRFLYEFGQSSTLHRCVEKHCSNDWNEAARSHLRTTTAAYESTDQWLHHRPHRFVLR